MTRLSGKWVQRAVSVLVMAAVLMLLGASSTRTNLLVDKASCRKENALFLSPTSCEVYSETSRGGPWPFLLHVSSAPTGRVALGPLDLPGSPHDLAPFTGVHQSFRPLSMLGDSCVAIACAIVIVGLYDLLTRKTRKTPPYGAVRVLRR